MPDAGSLTNEEVIAVPSFVAITTGTVAQLSDNDNEVVEVSFLPARPPVGTSQEVFGTVALTQTSFGAVENVDGTRVQHVHDRALLRAVEDLTEELRNLRNSKEEGERL